MMILRIDFSTGKIATAWTQQFMAEEMLVRAGSPITRPAS